MAAHRAVRWRRALVALAVVAAVWAVLVGATGGFAINPAGIRVSSRSVRNPILFTALSLSAAAWLAAPRWRTLADDLRWWCRLSADAFRSIASGLRRALPAHLVTILTIGGGASLIAIWIGARPLWLDEEMIALNIRGRSLPELGGSLWLGQGAPFGWLAAERVVMLVFGSGEVALRAVPVAFGVATLAGARWVGRRWMSWPGAVALLLLTGLGEWSFSYSLELKHYSADLLSGLMLPVLVVWATEAADRRERLRRAAVFWVAAAAGQWFSVGALLVTPACALALWILLWKADGRRSAVLAASMGFLWLAALGLHYAVTLRFTMNSDYLREYWSALALPPASAALGGRIAWLAAQAAPFAVKPGGTRLPILFWAAAIGGFVFARPHRLGWILAAVPLSASMLAVARLVPVYERLSLWVLPTFYVGMALAVDAAVRRGREVFTAGVARAALPVLAGLAGLVVCADVATRGWDSVLHGHPITSNHRLNDRSGVSWLLAQRRPGDAVLTTHLALPAVWWYGNAPLGSPALGAAFSDGDAILEVSYPGPSSLPCDDEALRRSLSSHKRLLVYFGFRFDDVPRGFDDMLLQDLGRIGHVARVQNFVGVTRAAIVELDPGFGPSSGAQASHPRPPAPSGCLSVEPARRW